MNNDIVGVTKIMETAGFSGEKGGGGGTELFFLPLRPLGANKNWMNSDITVGDLLIPHIIISKNLNLSEQLGQSNVMSSCLKFEF